MHQTSSQHVHTVYIQPIKITDTTNEKQRMQLSTCSQYLHKIPSLNRYRNAFQHMKVVRKCMGFVIRKFYSDAAFLGYQNQNLWDLNRLIKSHVFSSYIVGYE